MEDGGTSRDRGPSGSGSLIVLVLDNNLKYRWRNIIKHARSDTVNPHVTQFIFIVGINFRRKAVARNLLSKMKASLKYPKINYF